MTSYNVALNFEDGVTRVIQCDDDEKVTDAAFRQKINLPMDCRDGVCGTCKCFAEKGTYELEFYMDESMSDEEAEAGYVLTCQMMPESDCVLRVPTSSAACKTAPEAVEGEVLAVETLSETSFSLKLKLAKPMGFLPGQYVNVTVPGTGQHRSYSFSSAQGSDEATFLIRNLPGGVMSSYLGAQAKVGDQVTLTGPMGAFYLRPIERSQLWLAGGTGLAPFLSMLEQLAEQGADQPIKLYYAVTRAADLVELDRVNALAEKIGNVTVVTVLAAEDEAHDRKGFVTDHLSAEDLCGGDCDVYLCGPPPMVDAVRAHFDTLGVTPANFHYEKFNPTETSAEAA
ncbi:ring-hydroxylating dioxygenase ferredoxin reductase family protein [Sulfitobacter sp. KE29]|uniref:benzoate 1,2-dioxygenase electron transfer component BenC n=1 Tax=unclassified Sulfitobacter TaxID=196795 RepID=UPI0023E17A40|nr:MULTISPECIES: benzoate 1,2-dioxygenase electron transfer component BenC [unclassified Sulfitobacter]MDF3418884.1 ring-hydroxylating dioxygenase ferredoxin reductase family protein [Sulfitobacter sp. Ks38]MDF3426366.1 ring-hydroxylating dioxygenase ferredoxin reductase family protein [Sulfitobacter sp. KE29]MDF3429947.1 ring-hydroxylating dioxygenase ferredoxin reductase family protein [Sulfitobacter sp. S46]MDF3444719.1 ring-hydroxylating dioxygenase ferredoxin reductase family protein [Sulf